MSGPLTLVAHLLLCFKKQLTNKYTLQILSIARSDSDFEIMTKKFT